MYNQKLLFFLVIISYIYAPTLFSWMLSTDGVWYKPYIIWMLITLGAYLLQKKSKRT